MAITDLTGTIWTFNDAIDFSSIQSSVRYYINFTTHFGSTLIEDATSIYLSQNSVSYYVDSFLSDVQVYSGSSWYEGTDNIVIEGGTDATNANLIAWLQTNAMQYIEPHDIIISYNGNTITMDDSGTEVLDTKGHWLPDDITIDYTKPSAITVSPLSVTSNGTYTASSGTAYSPVTVNVSGGTDTVVDFIENHGTLSSFEHSTITTIGTGAFYYCSNLTTVNFPSCTSIGNNAFYSCSKLTTASFPICQTIGNYAFYSCSSLTTANFPSCTSIGNYAFRSCRTLTTASFPACSSIGTSAFASCFNLVSLYLLGSSITKLSNSNAFTSTPIAGYTTSTGGVYGSIYVPSSLYSSYISATNWTYFSSRFVSV